VWCIKINNISKANMHDIENITGKNQEIVTKIPITQAEVEQIRKIYKLDFPCPHCKENINDDHFSKDQRVLQLIDEKLREITERHLNFRKNIIRQEFLEEIKRSRSYENFQEVKKIRQGLEEKEEKIAVLKEDIATLNSSEYVEKIGRVKELKEENEKLREQNQMLQRLSKKSGQDKGKEFEKWFLEELLTVFDGRDNVQDISKGQTGTGKRADFLQEVLTETEPRKVAGRIVYETKNAKSFDSNWITKLENDMRTHGADYGFIVATCESDTIIRSERSVDPKKKIYISGDNNNLFMVVKIMRELLITRHKFLETINSSVKEQKIKKLDDWIDDKLPRYISSLEKQLQIQEKEANDIISKAGKIKDSREEIRKLIIDKINLEIRNI
jgi:hypothetical protein